MLLDVPIPIDLPHVDELVKQPHGTLVLWQNLDTLAAGATSAQDALGNRMDLARDHLSLVFHRFLGSRQHALTIALNLNPLRALDPFLTSHKATQALPEEEFSVEGRNREGGAVYPPRTFPSCQRATCKLLAARRVCGATKVSMSTATSG
jgi:hypothetical protein